MPCAGALAPWGAAAMEGGRPGGDPTVKLQAQPQTQAICCDVGSEQALLLGRVRAPKNFIQGSRFLRDPTNHRDHVQRPQGTEEEAASRGKVGTRLGLMSGAGAAPGSVLGVLGACRFGDCRGSDETYPSSLQARCPCVCTQAPWIPGVLGDLGLGLPWRCVSGLGSSQDRATFPLR